MSALFELTLPAVLENLPKFSESIAGCAREQGLSQKKILDIELALEEVLVNIFSYAYKDMEGDVHVCCSTDPDGKFVIEIVDTGAPFDVLAKEDPDTSIDIMDREIGGLGIFLTKKLMDDVNYERDGDKNVLTLTLEIA